MGNEQCCQLREMSAWLCLVWRCYLELVDWGEIIMCLGNILFWWMPSAGKQPVVFAFFLFVVSISTLNMNSTIANCQNKLFLVYNEYFYHMLLLKITGLKCVWYTICFLFHQSTDFLRLEWAWIPLQHCFNQKRLKIKLSL